MKKSFLPRFFVLACAILLAPSAVRAQLITGGAGSSVTDEWPDGTIEQTCAPYDGPAFLVLSKRSDGTFVRLMGMDSIEKANGTWAVVLGAQRGSGQASICEPQKSAELRCAYGRSGSFIVKQTGTNEWRVEFSASFMQAGKVNDVRGAFKVTRPRQDHSQSRFCG